MPVSQIPVTRPDRKTVSHRFFSDGNPKLMVTLPGRGYVNSHPVLHYLTLAAVQKGYDVLQVSYAFQVLPDVAYAMPDLADEVSAALEAVLRGRTYTHLVLAGKSLGTPLAAATIHTLPIAHKRLLLLTPIGRAVDMVGDVETLAIIGTGDAAYSPEDVARAPAHVTWAVYPDLTHSLEHPDDWRASHTVLRDIIERCEAEVLY